MIEFNLMQFLAVSNEVLSLVNSGQFTNAQVEKMVIRLYAPKSDDKVSFALGIPRTPSENYTLKS